MTVGMVGVRFAGLDGVTLESAKIAHVLREAGHEVVWFAGELGFEFSPGVVFPPAHFLNPENLALNEACFGATVRSEETSLTLRRRTDELKAALGDFVDTFGVESLVPQNALAIPLQLPLGLAITEFVADRGLRGVAHGHDFAWERERFAVNGVADVLAAAFPPPGPEFEHIVINSLQAHELRRRLGRAPIVLPNVMDFQVGPPPADPNRFRADARLEPSDVVLLQPTRIVPRKNIEASIELAGRLGDDRVRLLITHPEQDEGGDYLDELRARADAAGVDLRLVPVEQPGGATLGDAYAAADIVLYPTVIEGFGNALVEAMFYRRPVLVNRYPVYVADIAPTGVQAIEIDAGEITAEAVRAVAEVLSNPDGVGAALERNYEIGVEHFSYEVVRERVVPLFARLG